MKTLIVVDMQNDFIDGSLGTKEAQAIVPNVVKKIDEYHKNGDRVIFTKDTHFSDYLHTSEGLKLPVEHCIRYTYGWNISKELPINPEDKIIEKLTFGYSDWDKELLLKEIEDGIELVGLCTDICVVSNALILKALYYEEHNITVDASCCAGVTPETHKAAIETMKMCQINVIGE